MYVFFRGKGNSHVSMGVFLRVCCVPLEHFSVELLLGDWFCEKHVIIASFVRTTLLLLCVLRNEGQL